MMDWLKNISWIAVLAVLASVVVYFLGWMLVATLFLVLFGVGLTFNNVLLMCWVGAFMVIGRDVLVKPLADSVQKWINPPPATEE